MTGPGPGSTTTCGEPVAGAAGHWEGLYRRRGLEELSWTQDGAGVSAELVDRLGLDAAEPIVDVGGGAGVLVDHLLAAGHRHVTVLDISAAALAIARDRVARGGYRPEWVEWTVADVGTWRPARRYRLWHDRAVFHFLTDPAGRAAYRRTAAAAVRPDGFLVIGTFAADGPDRCSGLPVARYGPDELAAQFAPEFTMLTGHDEYHRTPWGDTQHFTWLVLRPRAPSSGPARVQR